MRRLRMLPVVLLLGAALPLFVRSADPQPVSISELIEQLGDTSFERREKAVKMLAEQGDAVIEPLVKAAQRASPEVTSRSVRLLERLMNCDDVDTVDAADAALVTLEDSDDPQAAALARAALDRRADVRQQRAVTRITELGGQVQVGPQVNAVGQPFPGMTVEEARQLKPRTILIGRDWKGGVEGLVHFRKLSHLSQLTIYVEKGSQVPLNAVQSLASVLPGLIVNPRGPYLGVAADPPGGPAGCTIRRVMEDGPADKAGLQAGDVVLALEGKPIGQFNDLVESLKDYGAGETVTISIQRIDPVTRQNRVVDLDVKLESWRLAPVAETVPLP